MDGLIEDLRRIAMAAFENLLTQLFFQSSFLLFVTFDTLWEIYFFDTKLWFCHLPVNLQVPSRINSTRY